MSDAVSSIKPKPQYFTSLDDTPTPLLPKEKPKPAAVNLEYQPPISPTAIATPLPPAPVNVDVSKMPTAMLERNVAALSKQMVTQPKSVTNADRARLDAMEKVLTARYAAETPPTLGGMAVKPPGVEICKRPADIPGNGAGLLLHHWLRTSHVEAGMGTEGKGVPGHDKENNAGLLSKTTINNHAGEGDLVDAECEPLPDVDETCVDDHLEFGTPTGRWFPVINDCHGVVADIVSDCKKPSVNAPNGDASVP